MVVTLVPFRKLIQRGLLSAMFSWSHSNGEGGYVVAAPDANASIDAFSHRVDDLVEDAAVQEAVLGLLEGMHTFDLHKWNAGHHLGKQRRCLGMLLPNQVVTMLDFKEKPKFTYR